LNGYFRLLRFALPYKGRFAAAIGCMFVLALATATYVNLLGPILDFLFTGQIRSAGAMARYLPSSIDLAGWAQHVDRQSVLIILPFVVVGVSLVKGIAYFGQFYLMGMVSQRIVADLRRALFDHLLVLSPGFFARRHSGDLMSRFSADVQAVENAVSNAVASYIRDGITIVVMLVNCFLLDWRLSLMAFVAVPVTLVPIIRLAKGLKRTTVQAQSTLGEIAELVQEAISGIRVVQSFVMERWESRRFKDRNDRWLGIVRKNYLVRAFSSPLMELMAAVGIALAIWWVGGRIIRGEVSAGKFMAFVAAVMLLYQPVKQLGRVGQIALQGAAAADRLFDILDAKSEVPDAGRIELASFADRIRFESVGFSYGDRPVLRDVTLEIRKGEVVALVGSSGGGKTTLANLLPRFWDVSEGRITIDGTDLREATLASLRGQLAVVTQETVLFNDTIRANIAYGRPEISQAEVERAARMAHAHEFIEAMSSGYDTVVGEKGVLLSGGQRQRIAIARAFLKNAPILILDEATSALDAESEREVQRAIESLMGLSGDAARSAQRTTLVIAHRLSTIRHADRIVVLAGGQIAEVGRHEELMARSGEYARLYRVYEGADHKVAARLG
jgi:subfamily B ATP-binding cassette protein MsbA